MAEDARVRSKRSAEEAELEIFGETNEDDERVVVAKLPGRFAKNADGTPMKWPAREGYSRFNVCSSARGITQELSPMLLGPVDIERFTGVKCADDQGKRLFGVELPRLAENLENAWQYSKLWPGEESAEGTPTRKWYVRRREGFLQKRGQRHVKKGKGVNRNVPLYSVWGAHRFRYVKARARIYCPIYAELVKKTNAYKELEQRLENGERLLLLDYDGYDRGDKTLYECFDDETKPFGHGFVLASLLLKLDPLPWERGVYTMDDSIGTK